MSRPSPAPLEVSASCASRPSSDLWRMLGFSLCLLVVCGASETVGRALAHPHASFVRAASVRTQSSRKLPSPEKIVGDYVKAIGGKKKLASLRDATYVWAVGRSGGEAGTARTQSKSPASLRTDIHFDGGEIDMAANSRSAWMRDADGRLRTLTDSEAFAARLQAQLEASRMLDYKKRNVLARTVALEQLRGEPAFIVEFSTRSGARLRYWFGTTSRLLLQVTDDARGLTLRFADWRAAGSDASLLEPHRVELERRGMEVLTLALQEARYNTGLDDSVFEPPGDAGLDIPALLRELARNQDDVDRRINDYTFLRKVTERKLNDRGEVTKETATVHEVYPVVGWGWVMKLVSENGTPLTPERAAKEEKRVAEELAKAEREAPKLEEKRQRKRAERAAKSKADGADAVDDEDDIGINTFLRACEFVSPRRERFRERDTIVFDFRARPGFRPSTRGESIASKLVGVVWVDPADQQVVRLEARLAEGFKMGGGLVASIKPGSAFVFEQTRLPDGLWLPRFSQVNASARLFLFAGMSINQTHEFSDYKRFSTKSGDATLDAPKERDAKTPPPR